MGVADRIYLRCPECGSTDLRPHMMVSENNATEAALSCFACGETLGRCEVSTGAEGESSSDGDHD